MKREHHHFEFFEIDHSIVVFVELFNQLFPVLVWYLFFLIAKHVFEFTRCYLPISIQVKQTKGLLQMLLCKHLVEVGGRCNEL